MSKMNGKNLSGFLRELFAAQLGLCFHCGSPMAEAVPFGGNRKLGWTREHVYPKARNRDLSHNIVLAHPPCNAKKGSREPTADEIERAKRIYERVGLVAFQAFGRSTLARCSWNNSHHYRRVYQQLYWEKGGVVTVEDMRKHRKD